MRNSVAYILTHCEKSQNYSNFYKFLEKNGENCSFSSSRWNFTQIPLWRFSPSPVILLCCWRLCQTFFFFMFFSLASFSFSRAFSCYLDIHYLLLTSLPLIFFSQAFLWAYGDIVESLVTLAITGTECIASKQTDTPLYNGCAIKNGGLSISSISCSIFIA